MISKQKHLIFLTSLSGFFLSLLLSISVFAESNGDCDAKTKASSKNLMQIYKDENSNEKKKCKKRPHDLAIVGTKIDPCTLERLYITVCNKPGMDNNFPAAGVLIPGEHYTPHTGEFLGM